MKFGGYIGITLSVGPSVVPYVCADTCPAHDFLFCFDIGIFHIWHMGVSPRDDVSRTLYDPDLTLTFDLKVKFIKFLPCLRVRPVTFFLL